MDEFDICWFDLAIQPDTLHKLKPYQRLSQWPGIESIAHKNKLAKNLRSLQKEFPEEYNFFPSTFILPAEHSEFKTAINSTPSPCKISPTKASRLRIESQDSSPLSEPPSKFFIVKPENMSQGKGIFLCRSFEEVNPSVHQIAQEYITNPLLINGLKFDLRIYVLLYGINPLRIYEFEDGLARLATVPYEAPTKWNFGN